jgi:hypothetical protein
MFNPVAISENEMANVKHAGLPRMTATKSWVLTFMSGLPGFPELEVVFEDLDRGEPTSKLFSRGWRPLRILRNFQNASVVEI